MKNDDTLEQLLMQLGCKTRLEDIPASEHRTLTAFLKQEKQLRHSQRLQRLLATCGIHKHQIRTFDQFDWNFNPLIPKEDILTFRNSAWISKPANLVLIGDAGIGKSHFAKAFCYDAIAQGHKAYFINAFDLVSKIKKAPYPLNKIDYYGKTLKVLCIDELGYTFHPKEDTDLLFQIISKRSELLPTIVTSNLTPKKWGSIFSGPAASAILDRLSFNGKFLTWEGESYRARVKT
jgi:DNA replication protein DnaC